MSCFILNHFSEGDADLYISQHTLHPSYNLSEYCLHSASCGQDRVDIPSVFKRPIGVAVYGHMLYPVSTYKLTVVLRDEFDQLGYEGSLVTEEFDSKRVGDIVTGRKIPQVIY